MTIDSKEVYNLLPAIYRLRDTERGNKLRALVSVIAEQLGVVEENLEQLYDDQFIETCADWVVPYIADLIGYQSLRGDSPEIRSPRREVARTIRLRRRKGTVTMLEQLARDVTGWGARAVEFFQLLGWTQHMNHLRPSNWYAPNLRLGEDIERVNTAFDDRAHTVDVRNVANNEGRYNVPNIGIFLWRLYPFSLTVPATVLRTNGIEDKRRFFFNPLRRDIQLFTRPRVESGQEVGHISEQRDVPMPISLRLLDAHPEWYYDSDFSSRTPKSFFIEGVDLGQINACDLTDWKRTPSTGEVDVDPVLGRITFPDDQAKPPKVFFQYGFSANMGGGEYDRLESFDGPSLPSAKIPDKKYSKIQDAIDDFHSGGSIEISDSDTYLDPISINVDNGAELELRAGNKRRPFLQLSTDLLIEGGTDSRVSLNGLLINGAVKVTADGSNKLSELHLRHCTIVPWTRPSLVVEIPNLTVEIDHCIVGSLLIVPESEAKINECIIDGNGTGRAYAGLDGLEAGGKLQICNSTVAREAHPTDSDIAGEVRTAELSLASNCVFLSPVTSERKQKGCVRFSYLPVSSAVPRRFRCQPTNSDDEMRVRPRFTSLRYGDPGYGQIASGTVEDILTGADDEGEMGAFHELYSPQREANLKTRLDEYLRFGLQSGVFYAT